MFWISTSDTIDYRLVVNAGWDYFFLWARKYPPSVASVEGRIDYVTAIERPARRWSGTSEQCSKSGRPNWLIDWLTDWLTNWLVHGLTDWLVHWLTGWLTDWLVHWLTDWLTGWLSGCLTDWLTDWLTDRPTGWQITCMPGFCPHISAN
jgi:hypothetical protein